MAICAEIGSVQVSRITESATIPTRAHITDAGYDLYADFEHKFILIKPGETKLVGTGIKIAIPRGYVGLIWDRSSMGVKGIHRYAGVIDSGYRGEVKVCLHNSKQSIEAVSRSNELTVSRGDRIAQILFQEVPVFKLVETDVLVETARGAGGFGSSGK